MCSCVSSCCSCMYSWWRVAVASRRLHPQPSPPPSPWPLVMTFTDVNMLCTRWDLLLHEDCFQLNKMCDNTEGITTTKLFIMWQERKHEANCTTITSVLCTSCACLQFLLNVFYVWWGTSLPQTNQIFWSTNFKFIHYIPYSRQINCTSSCTFYIWTFVFL